MGVTDTEPSAEGRRRYELDGRYEDGTPCRCKADCPPSCTGECGCEACRRAYADYGLEAQA